MSNVLDDIVDEIEIKPNKSKLIIKWIVGVSLTLIVSAFTVGEVKSNFFNRLDNIEEKIDETNKKIDKVDADINKKLDETIIINNGQHMMMIEYGNYDKEMLKKFINMNIIPNNYQKK
jgi:hypothetical protein